MNKPIEIQYPRTLLLENTVRVRAEIDDPAHIHEAATSLNRFIRAQGAVPRGPLVQVVQVDHENGRNPPSTELMRQASAPIDGDGERFRFSPAVEVSGCVLATFRGDAAHMQVAYGKLAVFSYENGVPLAGTYYIVLVEQEGTALSADIFAVTGEEL